MTSKNPNLDLLIERARQATFNQRPSRRSFLWRSALGGSAAAAAFATKRGWAGAQDAEGGAGLTSISREEYQAKLNEAYPINADAPQGGVFILGDITDITTTNGMLGGDSPTNDINIGLIYETLVSSDAVDPGYVPGLADSWEISEDGLTYTYALNPNVSWHDGTPFTADDVIFSFEAQSSEDTTSSYTASFNDAVASWERVDDHTVVVTATQAFAPLVFFGNSYCPIVPKHIWEGVPLAEWAADPGSTGQDPERVVGTGPFKFVEWVQGETVRLARNEEYWDQTAIPNIDELIFQVWPDQSTLTEAILAGDVDAAERTPPADAQSFMDNEETDVVILDTYGFTWYGYNLDPEKTTVFQDVEVRQALYYALDLQSIVDNIYLGYGVVPQGTQPVLSLAYAPDEIETKYSYDPAKAMELLDAAGWVDAGDGVREKDGQKLEFEVMYTGGVAVYDQLVPYMQEAWAEIGANMTPAPVDFGSVLVPAITENFDYDICLLGFSWDVTADQSSMFGTDYYKVGFNAMRYSNPEVDELFAQANVELDPERRREILVQAQNIVNNDLPVGIIVFRQDIDAFNVRIKNWNPNAYAGLLWSLPYVWVEE